MGVFPDIVSVLSDRCVVDGPVLTQTDLYLLGTELQINPILQHEGDTDFHLVFNLSTGALPSVY